MKRSKTIYILLAVLAAVCLACFAAGRIENKKENIKASGETVLSVPIDTVSVLSWEYGDESYAFHRGEDGCWVYDADETFPADTNKIDNLIMQFADFCADFTIEDVDDSAVYGLDKPVCTVRFTADGTDYTVTLGDFSQIDSERYVSLGDGKVYLAKHDPQEEFDAQINELIKNDAVPSLDKADEISFSGSENYTVSYDEERSSLCAEDVYFADGLSLDTKNVGSYLSYISFLDLSDYVSYNAAAEELEAFGLDEPSLTVTVKYTPEDEPQQTFILNLGRNREELAAQKEAIESESEDIPEVTCYARVGESCIIYKIDSASYDHLLDASGNTLRHQELFSGDLEQIRRIDVSLDGESYTFTYGLSTDTEEEAEETEKESSDEEEKWYLGAEEADVSKLKSAITALAASGFTDSEKGDKEEISFILYLENENYPQISFEILRYDGQLCLVKIDGVTTAFIDRALAVDLIEAVNEIVL